MKKLSVAIVSVLALMMCVALCSCGGGGLFGSKTTDADRFKGTWECNGTDKKSNIKFNVTATFSDEKFTLKGKKNDVDWTYAVDQKYVIESSTKLATYTASGNESYLYEFQNDGKNLSLKPQFKIDEYDGVEFYFTKK